MTAARKATQTPLTPRLASAELLRQAAAFADPEWGQGGNAVDAQGRPADPGSPEAVRRCAQGLLLREIRRRPQLHYGNLFPAVQANLPPPADHLPEWNDQPGRKPAEVRALFQRAAAWLEDRERTRPPEDPRPPEPYPAAFARPEGPAANP